MDSDSTPDGQANDEVVDFRSLAAMLLGRRWWIFACVLLSVALFAAVAFLSTPVYRASTVLVSTGAERKSMSGSLTSALGSLGGLASLAGVGNLGGGDAATEECVAVLRSRQFTEAFIRDNGLMAKLFPEKWDMSAGKWKGGEADQPTFAQAYRLFDKHVRSLSQDKKTGLATLNIDWKDGTEAAAWANSLVARLNAEMRGRAIEKADASVGYLEKELASTSDIGTRESINHLIENEVRERMLANVTQEYAFRVVDRAMSPDPKEPLRPQKFMLLVVSPFVGLGAGILFALIFHALVPPGRTRSSAVTVNAK